LARVPYRAELALRCHEVRAIHTLQQRPAGLAVAVFTRNRSAIFDDEIGCFVKKSLPVLQALFAREVEIDAAVHESVAEMTVDGGIVAMLVE
jgi:hypothetical protein